MHGKVSMMTNLGSQIFNGIPKEFNATRYHSLVIQNNTLPSDFKIISDTIDNGKSNNGNRTQSISMFWSAISS